MTLLVHKIITIFLSSSFRTTRNEREQERGFQPHTTFCSLSSAMSFCAAFFLLLRRRKKFLFSHSRNFFLCSPSLHFNWIYTEWDNFNVQADLLLFFTTFLSLFRPESSFSWKKTRRKLCFSYFHQKRKSFSSKRTESFRTRFTKMQVSHTKISKNFTKFSEFELIC